jgi:hypothetical protein
MIDTNKILHKAKTVMSTELLNHLKNVNSNCLIGLCIKQILLRDVELKKLLKELKTISQENPGIMIPISGEEAYSLLMGQRSLSPGTSSEFSP